MNISRVKLVMYFIVCGFVFMFITTSLLGSAGVRGFPKYPDTFLLTNSPVPWKNTVSTILVPVKIVLIGPLLLPSVNILKEDPPPPFIGIYFILYWSVLAAIIHSLIGKLRRVKN